MADFTKKALEKAFIELSETMPIEKITVTAVTKACGVNRNTFYYHYHDIYDLLDEALEVRASKLFVMDDPTDFESWKSTLRLIGAYGKKNKDFILNVYNSIGRDNFEDKMENISYNALLPLLKNIAKYENVEEENIRMVAALFAHVFADVTVNWLRGKTGDSSEVMEKAIVLLDGVPDLLLKNITGKPLAE